MPESAKSSGVNWSTNPRSVRSAFNEGAPVESRATRTEACEVRLAAAGLERLTLALSAPPTVNARQVLLTAFSDSPPPHAASPNPRLSPSTEASAAFASERRSLATKYGVVPEAISGNLCACL